MGRHTVCAIAGRRIDVQPCKTNPGFVQVQILGADRQTLSFVTLTADAAGVLAQALELEAVGAALVRDRVDVLAMAAAGVSEVLA